ncbi:aspartate kinase [Rhizobium halophytocola]|uniref:aspartate kinase n=1 Tax=Rhizobium halophytocola TaxID=735519 RepID=A0ABS4DUQ1_9HYPH|nr:aspartate kinase [Rhizobium halophytocola]MBP1849419.1 aspartate kinase [Rhizobium halophytocola]
MTDTKFAHTVEKIGGTSMSRTAELLDTVLKGNRKGPALYNRIFVVSAYAGITDALLEHKKSGEPGVYSLFARAEGGWAWGDALTGVLERMYALNRAIFSDDMACRTADQFVRERVEGVRSCLIDLTRLCSFGHFQLEQHLLSVREMLSSLGEAQSAFNTSLLLDLAGVNARFVDLTGWREDRQLTLDETIAQAFADVDPSRELPIVTGYAQCSEVLMGTYDRGYSEVTLSRLAVVTGAREAIIHKEFHLSSADPNVVGADVVRVIGETNYDVADQLSNMGMEAIHPRAAKGLRQAGIPLRVKNAFEPEHDGTLIRADLDAPTPQVEIITGLKNVYAFEFHDPDMVGVKGYDAKILDALRRHKIWIISKTSNANTITHFLKGSMQAVKRVEADLSDAFPSAEIQLRKVSLVSAIGRNLGDAAVLTKAIGVLAAAGIQPLGVNDLIRKVDLQVIVDPADFEATLSALHKGLIEDRTSAGQAPLHAAA